MEKMTNSYVLPKDLGETKKEWETSDFITL